MVLSGLQLSPGWWRENSWMVTFHLRECGVGEAVCYLGKEHLAGTKAVRFTEFCGLELEPDWGQECKGTLDR